MEVNGKAHNFHLIKVVETILSCQHFHTSAGSCATFFLFFWRMNSDQYFLFFLISRISGSITIMIMILIIGYFFFSTGSILELFTPDLFLATGAGSVFW